MTVGAVVKSKRWRASRLSSSMGFLLPTVIVISLAVMTLSTVALRVISDSSLTLNNQQFDREAQNAAKSGVAAAVACVRQGTVTWTDASPLKSDTNCAGGTASTNKYVSQNNNWKTSYTVGLPTPTGSNYTVIATGKLELFRQDGVTVAQTFTQTSKAILSGSAARPVGTVTSISVGVAHTCAITISGLPYCWGDSTTGQVGDNDASVVTKSYNPSPRAVSQTALTSGKSYTALDAGGGHTCGIAGGLPFCWGSNLSSQMGDGSTGVSVNGGPAYPLIATPTPVNNAAFGGRTLTALSSGGGSSITSQTCAIASGKAYCWGENYNGESGGTSNIVIRFPEQICIPFFGCFPGPIIFSFASPPVAVNGTISAKTVTAISSGVSHGCGVASDGTAHCWGFGTRGQLGNGGVVSQAVSVAVRSNSGDEIFGKKITKISAGQTHTCAIVESGELFCWGDNNFGQLGFGGQDNTTYPIPYSVTTRSAALTGKKVTDVQAGFGSTCAIADNELYCWGRNEKGQLGLGFTSNTYADPNAPTAAEMTGAKTPTKVVSPLLTGKTITQISVYGTHACAVADFYAYCWGANASGQLGNASNVDSNLPVAVKSGDLNASGRTASDIVTGASHTCAVSSGKPVCWGQNAWGQLGNGESNISYIASPVSSVMTNIGAKTVTKVVVSNSILLFNGDQSHSCALASGEAYCWGSNVAGQLGTGAAAGATLTVPTAVKTTGGVLAGKTLTDITAGYAHTCSVANDSKIYCWGNNLQGQLGNGAYFQFALEPIAASVAGEMGSKVVTRVTAGFGHTCALAEAAVYCWGANESGQLGTGTTDASALSKKVIFLPPAVTVTDISSGGNTSCAVADSKVYCWGKNNFGQLGIPSSTPQSTVAIPILGPLAGKIVTQISVGGGHACALANGDVYCWGSNNFGQLGDGTTNSSSTPVLIPKSGTLLNDKVITKVVAGDNATCVLAESKPYCWGLNSSGQIGDTTNITRLQPTLPYSFESLTTGGLGGGGSIPGEGAQEVIYF